MIKTSPSLFICVKSRSVHEMVNIYDESFSDTCTKGLLSATQLSRSSTSLVILILIGNPFI